MNQENLEDAMNHRSIMIYVEVTSRSALTDHVCGYGYVDFVLDLFLAIGHFPQDDVQSKINDIGLKRVTVGLKGGQL